MSSKHFVITVERQYGSGGRLTSERLAKELGIHFYDEEILKMTSETSAIGEQYFRLAELLGLQGNTAARIILGSVFDWKDIACYGAGCLLIQIFEIRRRAL